MKGKLVVSVVIIVSFFIIAISILIGIRDNHKMDIIKFTAFYNMQGTSINADNDIKELLAEKTGVDCEEIWLGSQSREDAYNSYIASGEYTDFIMGDLELYEAGALIPIDEYWDQYPNIRYYMSDEEWDRLRLDDGHIYWIPQFGVVNGEDTELVHEGEAFWIQTRVLKWAGYPQVDTLEEYFDLIEQYYAHNKVMDNGTANIPFTILCDDWRYFCLENPPQFLDGYPNDGSCMVDIKTRKVMDYNTTPTAKIYFKKLNEEFKKGIIDPESFTSTYEEYLDKLSTGAVLGMVDQWWQFNYDIDSAYKRQNLSSKGCSYVPLPITIEKGIKNQWHVSRSNEVDVSKGLSVTISCKEIQKALQFINDLLEPEIQLIRYWGIKDVDYYVDENGIFYLTEEQRNRADNADYIRSHFCSYSFFPRVEGKIKGNVNYFSPEYQPGEFFASLPDDVKECLDAYGCKTYVEMLGANKQPGPWYPMYSYSALLTTKTESGIVWNNLNEVKQTWLPKVVLSKNFDGTWERYMDAYKACNPSVFFNDMQKGLDRRIAMHTDID